MELSTVATVILEGEDEHIANFQDPRNVQDAVSLDTWLLRGKRLRRGADQDFCFVFLDKAQIENHMPDTRCDRKNTNAKWLHKLMTKGQPPEVLPATWIWKRKRKVTSVRFNAMGWMMSQMGEGQRTHPSLTWNWLTRRRSYPQHV